ncbi:MAG TPA: four helix bundle protein [Kofleriaceae bacterium]|nr:four helix bundle protein [Kofleriaceae bacterium]
MTLSETLSIELIHALRPVVAALRAKHHAAVADQLERAGTSVALNVAEAGGRAGRDSVRVLRIAAGECREVRAALRVVAAWGYADDAVLAPPELVANRLGGVLFGLVRSLA